MLSTNTDGGVDYTATNQTIIFLPGETMMSVTVSITDDRIHEENESFIAVLKTSDSTPDHISIGPQSTAVGVIIDDDVLGKYTHMFSVKYMRNRIIVYASTHVYKFGILLQLFSLKMTLAVQLNLMAQYHSQSSHWFHLMYHLPFRFVPERVILNLLKVC